MNYLIKHECLPIRHPNNPQHIIGYTKPIRTYPADDKAIIISNDNKKYYIHPEGSLRRYK